MSEETLPGKLSRKEGFSAESQIVVEKERGGVLLLFLMVVGLGAVALTSITIPAPLNFYDDDNRSGSISDSSNSAAISTTLAASIKATDGKGATIENNSVTESDGITLSEYFNGRYSTELRCSIDSLPVYCSGSPVTIPNLPEGTHEFTVVHASIEETRPLVFSWKNIPFN
jgi:hypothetical protein